MTQLYANNAKSRLNTGVGTGDTTFTLNSGEGARFPSPSGSDYFLVTLFTYNDTGEVNHEICKCTSRAGDILTVVRAQESTTARTWPSATPLELRVTKETLDKFVAEGDSIGATSPSTGTFTALTANNSLSVTGNITVTGTVDGRDVASDGSKLDGIESGATADQVWGEIGGTVTNQTDLVAEINASAVALSIALG